MQSLRKSLLAKIFGASAAFCCFAQANAQNLQFGGYLSTGYIDSSYYNYLVDSEGGDADFVEAGFNVSWTPFDRATVNGQLFTHELGSYGNYEPLIDYLFFDYNFRREFGVRIGRIKREFGIYNHIQDVDISRSSILLPIGHYDRRYRDIGNYVDGISAYGNIPLGGKQSIDYTVYGGVLDLKGNGGVAAFLLTAVSRDAENPQLLRLDEDYVVGSQVWYNTPIEGLRIGASYFYVPNTSFATSGTYPMDYFLPFLAGQQYVVTGEDSDASYKQFSIEYYFNEWTFSAEYLLNYSNLDTTIMVPGFPDYFVHSSGVGDVWYASISRRWDKLEVGLTRMELYGNANDRSGASLAIPHSGFTKDNQLSIRYDVTDNWTLKAEYHDIHGTNILFNQNGQNPLLDRAKWSFWALKSTFYF